MTEVLSNRVLNRTLLARQHLLDRTTLDAAQMCTHLVGLQAQEVRPPFIGLWSRIADFDPIVISDGLEDRSLVRITLMRGTIHLVTASDAVRIAPLIQPELEKAPFRKGFFFGATVGMDREDVRARGERILGDEPMTTAELRKLITAEWPDRDPGAVLQALLYLLPVLQTPPRGKWGHNERPRWARISTWLGRPLESDYPAEELVLRYLRAFGPASTMDMQTWSRLTGLRPAVERLGDRVRTYTDERGRVLYDAADAELADPELPAPVRYLGVYDNALLSHQDRTRIVPETGAKVSQSFSPAPSPVLFDGFVAAWYRIDAAADSARLVVAPGARISKKTAAAIEAEGMRMLAFLEPDKRAEFELAPPR
ncbi:winged helix DNA-binding domain-containing protein [Aldersonia kunmingensis]|uniref:winged helix DNA-binding domain-containing protein n=1 Tax=Aldersonia kunmingensis TaxID=408066 RepID=UPI00082A88E3|nr:winged helix DNA-binding domain-containing protein [Aldersonia kunmingensis]